MVVCVICKTQIRRSCLQRQLLVTLSISINKKYKEIIKQDSKHICKHLPGILSEFS